MTPTVLITGGAGGMGLATARIMGHDHAVVLTDIAQAGLDAAAADLAASGIPVQTITADITDRASVDAAVAVAQSAGPLRAVVHTAGVSPQMGDPAFIVRVNALGTINVTEAALAAATDGFALVNVASVAAHLVPGLLVPTRSFATALRDPERLVTVLTRRAGLFRGQRAGIAYSFSKAFVVWYTRRMAEAFGAKGARIVSVSPGTFDTTMGRLEEKSGSGNLLRVAALRRYGKPEEVAELLAFLASDKAGYITGTDVLIDGGTKAGVEVHGSRSIR
ncbi:SDR family oxidoreductase [Microbacterium thalassium]|uniref:NAD(P)-dependent dehydrogenase (Short-subunit alcohol dehydrogenase family) n=1 Tax=Microbacterium thalassium TaxID=362649 RepID=A0A7X0FP20_9MICO|nr:SDR family oxidoreductase [Microbacterium thalassium]MBB6390491.1 NAD(P)-dependent dehydrogenase (short-subunit alcohol dehydrogenase family) [Microbacterium thalassium]GLK25601.1 oxidoreductase [Microbacterium thalassium]